MWGVMMPPLLGWEEGMIGSHGCLCYVEELDREQASGRYPFFHAVSYLLRVDRDRLG